MQTAMIAETENNWVKIREDLQQESTAQIFWENLVE